MIPVELAVPDENMGCGSIMRGPDDQKRQRPVKIGNAPRMRDGAGLGFLILEIRQALETRLR